MDGWSGRAEGPSYLMDRSSTSAMIVSLGPISGRRPAAPNARCGGITVLPERADLHPGQELRPACGGIAVRPLGRVTPTMVGSIG